MLHLRPLCAGRVLGDPLRVGGRLTEGVDDVTPVSGPSPAVSYPGRAGSYRWIDNLTSPRPKVGTTLFGSSGRVS